MNLTCPGAGVKANGGTVNVEKLSAALGIPVVPISASKGEGVSELIDKAVTVAEKVTGVPASAGVWLTPNEHATTERSYS